MRLAPGLLALALAARAASIQADTATIHIDAAKPRPEINPRMYGVFLEEIWNVWDYRRTHGMGFYEYLQFCEDIGAEPMYAGFAGQTCLYRHSTNVSLSAMPPIEESFLDAVEFANGPAGSKWGRMRAELGHPAPFNLKLLEIGNENAGREYEELYALLYPLLKAKYPGLTLFRQPTAFL